MNSGALRSFVKLQVLTDVQDVDGELSQAWVDLDSLWADIRHQGGLETLKGGAETSVVRTSIRIRYRDSITSGMRVLHGSMAYNIKAVLPDVARKEHVDLVCEVAS